MKRLISAVVLAVALLPSAHAVLPTFDAASLAQIVKLYVQGEKQLSALGGIVGLNESQRDSLRLIDTAIGVSRGTINPKNLSLSQLAHLTQGLGLDANGSISKIYQSSGPFAGALDVFMGTTLESFRAQQGGPLQAFATNSTNAAMNNLGLAAGLNDNEISLAKSVASMTPAQRSQNSLNINRSLAVMELERYAKGAEQRRLSVQAEANMAQAAAQRASEAKTLNESAAAGNEIAAASARLAALHTQQANEANELLKSQGELTNATLIEMQNRRAREDAELRLSRGGP